MPQGMGRQKITHSHIRMLLRPFSVSKLTPNANLVRMVLGAAGKPLPPRFASATRLSTAAWFDKKPIVALDTITMMAAHQAVREKQSERVRRRGKSAVLESVLSMHPIHYSDDKVDRPEIALLDEAPRLLGAHEAGVAGARRVRQPKRDATVQRVTFVRSRQAVKSNPTPLRPASVGIPQDIRESIELLDAGCRVWERPIKVPVPAFIPRSQRRATVITVTDLGGGADKSTLAAQLGLKLAQQGDRVLLVDLDYRGSLSALCFKPENRAELRKAGRTTLRWLDRRPGELPDNALAECISKLVAPGLFAVPGDERLGVWEARERARSIVQPAKDDIRFRLRGALHNPEISRRFDWILLDCPGRISTASINGLAASDYVLLSGDAGQTVQPLVRHFMAWLARLNVLTGVCRGLSLLGMVNIDNATEIEESVRHSRAQAPAQVSLSRRTLTADASRRDEGGWRDGVYYFANSMPRMSKACNAAGRRTDAVRTAKAWHQRFVGLAQELRQRVTARGKPR
jgi:hypothetical protein